MYAVIVVQRSQNRYYVSIWQPMSLYAFRGGRTNHFEWLYLQIPFSWHGALSMDLGDTVSAHDSWYLQIKHM